MIPTIGAMIGGYIIFRCIEALCRADNQFSSETGRRTVVVFAVLGIIATGFMTLNLLLGSGASGLK